MDLPSLDAAVFPAADALRSRGLAQPRVLFFMGTGVGTIPGLLESVDHVPLSSITGVPPAWRSAVIIAGRIGNDDVWLLDDSPGDLESGEGGQATAPEWERAFPVWLAAAMGATLCVHTSAGVTLKPGANEHPIGNLALVSDHMNLSGRTPLRGLGVTRLGPLFPDVTSLHHEGLRAKATEVAKRSGFLARPAIAACTVGPTSHTPAELAWLAKTGADIVVQGVADPYLACAHTGLSVLAIVALTDAGDRPLKLEELVTRAEACAPVLEDLVTALLPDLCTVARELEEEV
jgi:purine-nucleoside phosphorylase